MSNNNGSKAYWGCGTLTFILIAGSIVAYKNTINGVIWWIVAAAISLICFIILLASLPKRKSKLQLVNYDSLIDELEQKVNLFDETSIEHKIITAFLERLKLQKQHQDIKVLHDHLVSKKRKKYQKQILDFEKDLKDIETKLSFVGFDACEGVNEITLKIYDKICQSFERLSNAKMVKYLTKDDKLTQVKIENGSFNQIICSYKVPLLNIINSGESIYIYPQYFIRARSFKDFKVIPFSKSSIDAQRHSIGWITDKDFPLDCTDYLKRYTYTKKDGSPDLRYSYNPIQYYPKYGQIKLSFLDGSLLISNQTLWYQFATDLASIIGQFNSNTQDISTFKDDDLERISRNVKTLKKKTNILRQKTEFIIKEQNNRKEVFTVADELFSLSQQLENDPGYRDELSKHRIKVTDSNGKPICGNGGEIRSLFFLDITHCYAEMADIIDLKRDDGIGILYLMFRLIEPVTPIPHDKQHIDVIKSTLPSGAESLINQIKDKPFFNDGDIDFTVAAILKRYNKDLLNKYLTLLFRYCSLIAKADGNITDKEQHFLDHIAQLRSNSMNSYEGVTVQKAPALSEKYDGIAELDGLIGLDSVKQEVRTMSNFIKVQLTRQQQGLKATQVSYHCVFTGNPGTGKTTVARILAGIYNELGVLKKGHLVETDRSGLVAEYVGQTAVKTNKVIDSALDGVLFIDEAYSLVTGSGNDYGNEAIATLLKRMEDNRDRLIVILAGYGNEMKQFIDSNPGLQSRFNRYIHFPDYNAGELLQIFARYAQKNDYDISAEAQEKLKSLLEDAVNNKDKNFGNGRFVRNLFEKTLERQANRLSGVERPTLSQLKEILPVDI